jgi:hypothetical protein
LSAHVGTLQVLDVQTPLVQSLATMHALPSAHFLLCASQVAPPQSTSVSPWFFTASEQVAAAHASGAPEHTRLWQSVVTAHVLLVPQAPQSGPPQSTSVSLPSFITSAQPVA